MLKYTETEVTFAEIPDEITLCINISNCPCHCPGCHSKHLWQDIGTYLTNGELHRLISQNKGISCVCLMGGDADTRWINILGAVIKTLGLKSAWYSGKNTLPLDICYDNFDYIKLGPYIEEKGPLNDPNTNQRLYKVDSNELIDITNKFWKSIIND